MNIDEILRALKENEITPYDAKKLMYTTTYPEAVAVVGISGKYAQADNAKEYWKVLSQGIEAVREVPESRWDTKKYYDPEHNKPGKMYSKWAGIIEDVESFDSMFFEIVPSEAEIMDPQQRMFIEEGYKAFEDAGYCKKTLDGSNCGIYFGIIKSEYDKILENGASNGTITGGSSAIAAARLSYFLNLKGPAISLDTACSSSLVGLHLAIQALNRKEIDLALVGGSSLYLTPEAFINMCQAGMLSSDGHCKAFDNAADGFVPGEGVAAVVIKRLEDAIKDHDHIYGTILASGINQDGHTNGITAPSKNSQYQLIHTIYEKYKIAPSSISYAELHGTGTSLGDPIELEALQKVFREGGCKEKGCAIGSVKSNIGHTTAAAGIAGLEKILLCMKHRQLVPTLNVKDPNHKFDFKHSSFYINQDLIPWNTDKNQPLRACLSSFGYSGTNSHVVVEEYSMEDQQRKSIPYSKEQPGLFLLSARTEESLKEYAKQMISYLEEETVSFDDLLYTMQSGRDAMKKRVAIITDSANDLLIKLNDYIQGRANSAVYEGTVKNMLVERDSYPLTSFQAEVVKEAASAWIKGKELDFSAVYAQYHLYRVSAPVYPLEKERFRVYYEKEKANEEDRKGQVPHPFLHLHTEASRKQSFRTILDRTEQLIRDHRIADAYVVPGAVTLEMAYAATQLAYDNKINRITDLSWNVPIEVQNEPLVLETNLYPEEKRTRFEITMQKEGYVIPCVEGYLSFEDFTEQGTEKVNLQTIKDKAVGVLPKAEFYERISNGVSYGEGLQVVDELLYNETQVLARISLPEEMKECTGICLSPAFVDGAFQTLCGFAFSQEKNEKQPTVLLPSSVKQIQLFADLPTEGYAYARKVTEKEQEDVFYIQILNLYGEVCVEFQTLCVKGKELHKKEAVCMIEEWQPCSLQNVESPMEDQQRLKLVFMDSQEKSHFLSRRYIVIEQGEAYKREDTNQYVINAYHIRDWERLFMDLNLNAYRSVEIIDLFSLQQKSEGKENESFTRLFLLAQTLMQQRTSPVVTLHHFYYEDNSWNTCKEAALYGLFQSIYHENPKFYFRTIGIKEQKLTEAKLELKLNVLHNNPQLPLELRSLGQEWYTKKRKLAQLTTEVKGIYRTRGTYLITGGTGTLGLLVANHLISECQANVILVGSRPLNEAIQKKLDALSENGGSAQYIQADVTVREEVVALAQKVPKLNGIIAAAGRVQDTLLRNKAVETACNIVDIKIGTSRYLDEAFADADLDFFLLFSSISAVLGTVGQSDYSYGNCYLDHFAAVRNHMVAEGKRKGRTISINWPYWDTEGMSIDADTLRALKQSYGIVPLQPEQGIALFDQAFHLGQSQVLYFYGDSKRIQNFMDQLDVVKNQPVFEEEESSQEVEDTEYKKLLMKYLKEKISEVTKIPTAKILPEEEFEIYGIDSIVIMAITRVLEEEFGVLPKTLFFEYRNVEELTDYFLKNHKAVVEKLFGKQKGNVVKTKEEANRTKEEANRTTESRILRFSEKQQVMEQSRKSKGSNEPVEESDEIAIIGVSGKYPMADNLEEFWNNLCQSKDCVTEIPKNRWDCEEYYSQDKGAVGKCNSKWGGFINDVEKFDPVFFQITPLEAEYMDPQVRLFLETTWHTLEDAGYTRASLQNQKVGVFVGVMYGLYQLVENNAHLTGNVSYASIANRVSYFFDFKGPSIAMDTMCSSSLTSIHVACKSILSGECDVAIAGGVNLILHPNKYVQLSQSNFTSTDGRCRSFGSGGNGYVPGEGVGAVLLKSKKAAILDGDHIYAVIKASAINAGGKSNGFTVPNPKAQSDVIREAIRQAGVNPRDITCIEAHGTGTSLGDPIEVSSITNVYREFTQETKYCSIGSVKSNLGHLESAAGMAALTKVLLEMQHKTLVPSIHSEVLNPYIDFEQTPFYVQRSVAEWNPGKRPRMAGISAFGAGGSNAHIILQEYEEAPVDISQKEAGPYLFVLSARNQESLLNYVEEMVHYLEQFHKERTQTESLNQNQSITEIFTVVIEILAFITGVSEEELKELGELESLSLNQYDYEQFLQQLEEKFQLRLQLEELLQQQSFDKLTAYLWQKCNKENGGHEVETTEEAVSLADLSYTLLVGREAMNSRLAVVASTEQELYQAFTDYKNRHESENVHTGDVSEIKEQVQAILTDEAFTLCVDHAMETKNLDKLAEYWLLGVKIDWTRLYRGERRRRISVPGYPFAKHRCWLVSEQESEQLVLPQHAVDEVNRPAVNANRAVAEGYKKQAERTITLSEDIKDTDLFKLAVQYLKGAFASVLKLPEEELLLDAEFEMYGIDSIYISKLNTFFEECFEELPSSLLFKYKTIRMLAKYLVEEQKERLLQLLTEETMGASERIEPSVPTGVEKTTNNETTSFESSRKEAKRNETTSFESSRNEEINDERPGHEVTTHESRGKVPIAIVGLSGKYPKARNLREFSRNLKEGMDCITEIPKDRWDYHDYPDIQCKWGGFIDEIDQFDPQFFGIAPMNALYMDPQERIFLEKVWECLEDAGYTPQMLADDRDFDQRGNVSVFAGVSFNTYCLEAAAELKNGNRLPINSQIYSVANRVSYTLNFSGESLSVDTACSSSLYALYLGCKSLWEGDSEMCIAGGVNLSLHPSKYIELDMSSFLASDGHCHSFGAGGDGYVPGEGVGVVLLKPLWKAEKDHDHIYGVIKGIAANHGGKTHGYTVPNPNAQTAVIEKALNLSGVNPRTISYVEAHGTGTALGDPIEIEALNDAYRKYTKDKEYCSIGSVKSNIGHLEAAAGISQITKVLLQMQSKTIFPSRLNSEQLNPNVKFDNTPFHVALEAKEWKRPVVDGVEYPRCAGISSFGVGGVNVHVILEEYDKANLQSTSEETELSIIPISAKTESALQQYIEAYLQWTNSIIEAIQNKQEVPRWEDFVYTIQTGRLFSTYRVTFVAKGYEDFFSLLQRYLAGDKTQTQIVSDRANSMYSETKVEETLYEERTKDKLISLAKAWTQGYLIEFERFHNGEEYRVSLPTYPFARERYWMYDLIQTQNSKAEEDSGEKESIELDDITQATQLDDKGQDEEKFTDISFLEEYYSLLDSEKKEYIMEYLQHMFAELLRFPEGKFPELDQGFFDMGLESLTSNAALATLESVFGMELDVQLLFNYPNIIKLAESLIPLVDDNEEAFNDFVNQKAQDSTENEVEAIKQVEADNLEEHMSVEHLIEEQHVPEEFEHFANADTDCLIEEDEFATMTTDELAKMLAEEMKI